MRIGVISDTHGLMRPEALKALAGVEAIVHAGDVGRPEVLEALRSIAPVHAIRGNVDAAAWAAALPETLDVDLDGERFHLVHRIQDAGYLTDTRAVVFGHSHKPSIEWRAGMLFLNPGSAGPRRFSLPITLALVETSGSRLQPSIVHLTA